MKKIPKKPTKTRKQRCRNLTFHVAQQEHFRNNLLQINTEIYRINHNKYGKIVHLMTQMT